MFESNLKISKKLDAVKYPPTDINAEILKILKQSGFKNPKIIHVSHNSEAGNMQYFTQFSCDKQSEEKSSKALNKLRSYKKGKCYMTDCYYIAYTEYSKGECYYKTDYKKQEEKSSNQTKSGPFKDKSLVSKITSNFTREIKGWAGYWKDASFKLVKSNDNSLVYHISKKHPYKDYTGQNKAHGISKQDILGSSLGLKDELYYTVLWALEEKLGQNQALSLCRNAPVNISIIKEVVKNDSKTFPWDSKSVDLVIEISIKLP